MYAAGRALADSTGRLYRLPCPDTVRHPAAREWTKANHRPPTVRRRTSIYFPDSALRERASLHEQALPGLTVVLNRVLPTPDCPPSQSATVAVSPLIGIVHVVLQDIAENILFKGAAIQENGLQLLPAPLNP